MSAIRRYPDTRTNLLSPGPRLGGASSQTLARRKRAPANAPSPANVVYYKGNYKITVGAPRAAVTSSGTGDYAWFMGLHRFPNGNILIRWSYNNDGLGAGQTKSIISTDDGATFPTASIYTVSGKPSTQEPMVMESTGTFHGGEFYQWDWPNADRRSIRCGYQTITNGGATYSYAARSCTITGFPTDIAELPGDPTAPYVSWTDRVIRVSDVEWYSTIGPLIVGEYQVFAYAIKSVDQGRNWVVVGQLNAHILGNEGYSETSTIKNGSRFISISRTGNSLVARAYSDDSMVTWTPTPASMAAPPYYVDQGMNVWGVSPFFDKLGNGAYLLTAGRCSQAVVDSGQARAREGLHIASDVMSNTWPVVDLHAHHNMLVDPSLTYDETLNITTGYRSWVELNSTATVSNILIGYDQAGGSYGTGTARPNRIFVVNARIEVLP